MKDFIVFGKYALPIKIAISKEEQARGLMGVPWPPPILVFPGKLEFKKFWMKDTPSPLDILFCKGDKIIEIFAGTPFCLEKFGPKEKCDLVVELPRGLANKFNLKNGDLVNINYSLETLAKIFEHKYYDFDR